MSTYDKSVGTSKYHEKTIQPWHIWEAFKLNPWRADLIKRLLRQKELDFDKIAHIAQHLIDNPEADFIAKVDHHPIPLADLFTEYNMGENERDMLFDIISYPLGSNQKLREISLERLIKNAKR